VIEGADVCRMAVPAEDMMQAFAYHHLVPARDGMVVLAGYGGAGPPLKLIGQGPVKLPAGGTARVQLSAPKGAFAQQVRLELDEPPKGIAIQEVSPDPQGVAMVLSVDAGDAKPGLKGNLILNAFREFTPETKDGEPKAAKQRTPLGMLPAIPFEVVASPPVADTARKPVLP